MSAKILFLSTFTFLIISNSFSKNNSETFNKIDAFTSGSLYLSLKVFNCSKAYENRAEIHWRENWECDKDVDAYKFKWGKDSSAFTDSIDCMNYHGTDKPYTEKTVNMEVLENLEPGTKYYVQIYRNYNRKLFLRPFVFTTPPLPTALPVSVDDEGYLDPLTEGDTCYTNPDPVITPRYTSNHSVLSNAQTVELVTVSGQYIATFPASIFSTHTSPTYLQLGNGVYYARFLDNNRSFIKSQKVLIEK